MLAVHNLNKSFGRRQVLDDISIGFEPHVYGLLGPNGAGKTTLIRCMTLLYNEGYKAITFDGERIRSSKEYLSHIGYLPQQFGLYKELTALEVLELLGSYKGLKKKEAREEGERCLGIVNLQDRMHDRVGTFSGGMMRRVGIAQALLGDPEILIFDEPTAGLDPEERLRFKTIIEEVKDDRCIIISTHIVEDVEATCDHIIVLADKKIQGNGSNDDIREAARGKVYDVSEAELGSIQGEHFVFKKYEKNQVVRYRLLSGTPQVLTPAIPEIEDGYLCLAKRI